MKSFKVILSAAILVTLFSVLNSVSLAGESSLLQDPIQGEETIAQMEARIERREQERDKLKNEQAEKDSYDLNATLKQAIEVVFGLDSQRKASLIAAQSRCETSKGRFELNEQLQINRLDQEVKPSHELTFEERQQKRREGTDQEAVEKIHVIEQGTCRTYGAGNGKPVQPLVKAESKAITIKTFEFSAKAYSRNGQYTYFEFSK